MNTLPSLAGFPTTALLDGIPTPALALVELALLLAIGRLIGGVLGLRHWGLPEALLAGFLGLAVVRITSPALVPLPVITLWAQLPTALLTMVFATLLLARPLPAAAGLWRPVSAQMLLALTLAFGQYLVGGLTILLLQPRLEGIHPLMACLIEAAYEGGHGSAAAMGPGYAALGYPGGASLGLALATVGLLASTVLGGALVLLARSRGWLLRSSCSTETGRIAVAPSPPVPSTDTGPAEWARNLALSGLAVAVGLTLLATLRWLAARLNGGGGSVFDALPVFPLALAGSLLVRLVLDRSGRGHWASRTLQNRLGTVSADLLITAATASLDLALLRQDWLPLSLLAVVGLGWNLLVLLLWAPRVLPPGWFERGITEFGQATGVVASGLLLLRMADPLDRSDTLTPFSVKQLMLQPLLAGGLLTVLAPQAVSRWGLEIWTVACLMMVLLWGGVGLALARRRA
jgi:ESS family glutamate:Na+ symporter